MKTKISTCILAKNEEKNIRDCILSVKDFSEEIIVIDNGSTDNTPEIYKDLGCCVIEKSSGTESELRNEYIKRAKNPWIFVIDADERVDIAFGNLDNYLANQNAEIYRFPVNNYYGSGKWCTFIKGLLFKKENMAYKGEVHCTLSFSGKYTFGFIPVVVHHLDALIKERAEGKRDKYIKNLEEQIEDPQYKEQKLRLINYLGVEWMAVGDYEKAQMCFEQVKNVDNFYQNLAKVYYCQSLIMQKRYSDVFEIMRSIIYKCPTDGTNIIIGKDTVPSLTDDLFQRCCVILAEAHYQIHEIENALYWTNQAIFTWPFASQHYINRKLLMDRFGKNDEEDICRAKELNSYLLRKEIYAMGDTINIYAFQTSLLQDTSKILEGLREQV